MNKKEKLEKKKRLRDRIKNHARKLKEEIKKSTNTAIVAALGFLMAFSWKDAITEYIEMVTNYSPIKGKIVTALIITLIGVIGIMATTKFLSQNE